MKQKSFFASLPNENRPKILHRRKKEMHHTTHKLPRHPD